MMALVVFVGGDLCIALPDQLGIDHQALDIDVGQEAAVLITPTFAKLETHVLTSYQTTIGFKGFLTAILGELVRVVDLRSIQTSMPG
jgi:hypothetical protein